MRLSPEIPHPEPAKTRWVPVYEDLPIGGRDPVSTYLRIRERFAGHSYLLESADTNPAGEKSGTPWGRYSFIGFMPHSVVRIYGRRLEVTGDGLAPVPGAFSNPIEGLRAVTDSYEVIGEPPRFGALAGGGLVGFCGYDLIRTWERLPSNPSDPELPEGVFMAAGGMLIFDHFEDRLRALMFAPENGDESAVISLSRARNELRALVALIGKDGEPPGRPPGLRVGRLQSNFTREDFMGCVREAKEKIHGGEAIQIVLSQRLSGAIEGDDFLIYRALKRINPSPYMFYLDFGPLKLIGASPEMLVRVQKGTVEVCPIAGTRPRGKGPVEDRALEAELLTDAKERAEHVMLVDLGRNDVGRVAAAGSVTVPRFMQVERYSHVMHLVSRVEGRLKPGKDCFDAFMSAFPAGTVSGAPKIRAMEIIQELENTPRGPYAGAVGWFGFGGDADFCIAIRTLVVADGRVSVQAGAGIVADSDPGLEYEETLRKAAAPLRAVEEAGEHARSDRQL